MAVKHYVVVGGWLNNNTPEMIECIGVFSNGNEAYGAAYLYLDERIENHETEGLTISRAIQLEAETGYGIYANNEKGDAEYYAYILFDESEEKHNEKVETYE